jgi:tetratricopeptide (TPR) repeat protein
MESCDDAQKRRFGASMKRTTRRPPVLSTWLHAAIHLVVACSIALACSLPTSVRAQTAAAPAPNAPPDTPALTVPERTGVTLLQKNDLAGAEAAFNEARAESPNTPGPLIGLAEIALRRNQAQQALEWLARAQSIAPRNALVHAYLGRAHTMTRDYPRAEASFNEAIGIDARSVTAHMGLGDLYVGPFKRPAEAIAHYEAVVKQVPDFAAAYIGLGRAHAELRNDDEAVRNFRIAAGLARSNPMPYHALGRLYVERNRLDEAIAAFDLALRINPQFLPALTDRATTLVQMGRDRQAMADLEAVAKARPADGMTRFKLGLLYYRDGRKTQAKATLLEAVKQQDDLALAYNLLAWIAAESRTDLDKALDWAKRAVELDPVEPGFQDTLGWVHRARGELGPAIAALAKAAATNPPRAVFHYHLGVASAEAGRFGEATAALKRALAIDANFSDAADARKRLATLEK